MIKIYNFEINLKALMSYLLTSPYHVQTYSVVGLSELHVEFSDTLTAVQATEARAFLDAFDNFAQETLDEDIMATCKNWGRDIINQFELKNINRKRLGLMGRIELKNILIEAHDSHIFICMLEGSLDTLHGLLYGFAAEGDTPAEAPITFNYVWAEDIAWLKDELNKILVTL